MRSAVVPGCVLLVLALELGGGHTSPVREKFVVHASSLSPHEGRTLTLTCYIGGPPQASIDAPSAYEWVKDGKIIPGETGKTFTLQSLTSQDEGDFQCGPPNPDTLREVFHLRVIRRQTSLLHETIFYVDKTGSSLQGRTVTLHCYFYGPLEITPSSYVWVKDGEVIPGETGQTFTLENLSSQNTGNYQCGDPDTDFPRRNYHLQVITILPRPVIFKDRLPVCDQPFSLKCIIMDGYTMNDRMLYTWYKGSTEIKGQSGQVLSFTCMTEADAGEYTCTARDGPIDTTSPHSQAFDVTPLVKPEVSIQPTNQNSLVKGILGESLTLTCKVNRAVPRVPFNGYSWSFLPPHQGQARQLEGTSPTLTLGPLTKADGGQYFCQARNDQDFETVTLVGQGSVAVDIAYLDNISLMTDANINDSDRVTLTCKVESHPTAHLTWIIGGEEVRHVIDNLDHYVITQTACMDSRNYTCHATNSDLLGREIMATTQLLANCKQEFTKKAERHGTIHADVAAPFDFSLPEQTSVVVVHPRGQDVITVHRNCSYIVSSAFRSRCLHPQCDPESHHLTFILTHVTDKDEGYYVCVDEKQRNPIPDCNQTLVLKRQVVDVIRPEPPIWWIIGAVSAVVWIATAVVLIIWQRRNIAELFIRLKLIIKSKVLSVAIWGEPSTGTQIEKGSHTFDRLYQRGKLYVFPRLVPPKQQVTAVNEKETTESTHLLPETAEDAEYIVKNIVRRTLQETTGNDGLPSFLLHNTCLSQEEKVILLLSRNLGVVLMIVKPVYNLEHMDSIQKAVNHLVEARKIVKKKLRGLVKSSKITAAIALPNLPETDMSFLRKHRMILRFQQNVEMLLGQDQSDFQQWAERLSRRSDSDVWDLSTHGLDSPDTAFMLAASKFLTLAGGRHPGDPSERPTAAESWLLTPDEMEVRDSTARLLHVWGSPGSGKTTLLIHRTRQWLAEGKAVVLAVGKEVYDVLLAYIIREVLRNQSSGNRKKIRVCRMHSKLQLTLKELKGQYPDSEICLVIDTLRDPLLFRNMLDAVNSQQVSAVWSVCRDSLQTISTALSQEAIVLGWESSKFPDSIRCTENTVDLLNRLGKGAPFHCPIIPCSVPRARDIPKLRVVDHCFHPNHATTLFSCDHCRAELSTALFVPGQDPHWSDWIALYTGNPNVFTDIKPICETLKNYSIPASLDSHYEIVASHGSHLDSSETDITKWLERVLTGVDETGNPTVHLVPVRDLAGMEKEGVLLVHWDKRDNDPKFQSHKDRETRLEEHRYLWFLAVSRCKSQVILLLLTPSPARSLLELPETVPTT